MKDFTSVKEKRCRTSHKLESVESSLLRSYFSVLSQWPLPTDFGFFITIYMYIIALTSENCHLPCALCKIWGSSQKGHLSCGGYERNMQTHFSPHQFKQTYSNLGQKIPSQYRNSAFISGRDLERNSMIILIRLHHYHGEDYCFCHYYYYYYYYYYYSFFFLRTRSFSDKHKTCTGMDPKWT